MKDAELSWLDARIVRRKTVTPGQTQNDHEENPETNGNKEEEVEEMEQDGDQVEGKRLSNLKVVAADTFCLEPMLSANIPPHQVCIFFFLFFVYFQSEYEK